MNQGRGMIHDQALEWMSDLDISIREVLGQAVLAKRSLEMNADYARRNIPRGLFGSLAHSPGMYRSASCHLDPALPKSTHRRRTRR